MKFGFFVPFCVGILFIGCAPQSCTQQSSETKTKISPDQARAIVHRLLEQVDAKNWDKIIEMHTEKIIFKPDWDPEFEKKQDNSQNLEAGIRRQTDTSVESKKVYKTFEKSFSFFDKTRYLAQNLEASKYKNGIVMAADLEILEVAKGKSKKLTGKLKLHINDSGKIEQVRVLRALPAHQSKAVTQEK